MYVLTTVVSTDLQEKGKNYQASTTPASGEFAGQGVDGTDQSDHPT